MLVLTRKIGEKVYVGDNVVVTVIEIRPDRVRLGIAAPKEVEVHREEVYNARREDKCHSQSDKG